MNFHSPKMNRLRGVAVGALLALCAAAPRPTQGHDLFEITTAAQLEPGQIVLNVAMARGTAMAACGREGAKMPGFENADFEQVRELFEARAGGLYALTAGGETLAARETRATLTSENDLEFRIVYARPKGGPLRFDARCLAKLPPEGYGVAFTALENAGGMVRVLGDALLTAESPALEINWPQATASTALPPAPRAAKVPLVPLTVAAVFLFAASIAIGRLHGRRAA